MSSKHLSATPSLRAAYYTLVILMIAGIVSLLDRQILALLIVPIRHDLHITDTQVSLLQGMAFAVFYALVGMPLGYAVDRTSRRNLIVVGLVCWSAATLSCGLAKTYLHLFVARIAVGAGEACLHPAAYSMISDLFGPDRRGRAYALFGGAATLGHALSLLGGGLIIGMVTRSGGLELPYLGHFGPWQSTFLVAGLPGLFLAVLMITVREPARQELAAKTAMTPARVPLLPAMRRLAGPIASVLVAAALIQLAGYGVIAWMATAYVRDFGVSLPSAGLIAGLILFGGAVIGAPIGGWLADRFANRGTPGGRFLVGGVTSLVGAAAFASWWMIDKLVIGIALGIVAFSTQVASATTLPAAMTDLVPNELRGRIIALYLLTSSIIGIGLGPTAIAMLTQYGFGYDGAVRYSMAIIPPICLVVASLVIWSTRQRYSASLWVKQSQTA